MISAKQETGAFNEGKQQMKKLEVQEFSGKNLFISGATSGIGRATALRFAQAGANVAAVGRDQTALEDLSKALHLLDVRCVMIPADLAHDDSVEVALAKGIDALGGIDILVNAAGHISNGTILLRHLLFRTRAGTEGA